MWQADWRMQTRRLTPSMCLVLFLAALDQTIIATALPTIAGQFNASPSQFSWVVTVSRSVGSEPRGCERSCSAESGEWEVGFDSAFWPN